MAGILDIVSSSATDADAASKAVPSKNEAVLRKACNDFETVLTTTILKEGMKSAKSLSEDDEQDNGSESYRDLAYEQLAGHIGRQGSLGLGEMLFKTLKTKLNQDMGEGK